MGTPTSVNPYKNVKATKPGFNLKWLLPFATGSKQRDGTLSLSEVEIATRYLSSKTGLHNKA